MPKNQPHKKTVLVTGWTGFIGRHLIRKLHLIPDLRLVLVSRSEGPGVPEGCVWIQSNLESLTENELKAAGADHVEIVFHLAGFIPKSATGFDSSLDAIHGNAVGTSQLLKSLPDGTNRIVLASTVDVYGYPQTDEVITEETVTAPVTVYAATKLLSEHLVSVYCREHQIQHCNLRLSHIYGPGEEAYRKLIPSVIRCVLAGDRPSIAGAGEAGRDYVYVDDAVNALIQVGTSEELEHATVNLVSGQSWSVREVVESIIRLSNVDVTPERIESNVPAMVLRFDPTRINQLIRNSPPTSLEVGLTKEINHFRNLLDHE